MRSHSSSPVSRAPVAITVAPASSGDGWTEPPRHRVAAPPLRHVRGSLIESSLAELRERGLLTAYRRVLDPAAEYMLFGPVADAWLPLGACMAHFAACDAVVPADVALQIGEASGKRVQQSVINTVLKLATGAGLTPWTVFAHYQRMWTRVFDGAAVTVSKVGPKDAVVSFDEFPLARYAYFRTAFRGTHEGMLRLFVKQVFVREQNPTKTSFRYAIAWA